MPEKNKFSTYNKNQEEKKSRIEAVNFIVQPCSFVTLSLSLSLFKKKYRPNQFLPIRRSIQFMTSRKQAARRHFMELLEDNLVEEPSLPVRGIPLRCAFDASVFFYCYYFE